MRSEIELLEKIEILTKENWDLLDELREIRPMARLAHLLSLIEGDNMKLHRTLVKAERELEDAELETSRLKVKLEGAEALLARLESKVG